MDLLVDMAEAELKRLSAQLRHQKETLAVLTREHERLRSDSVRVAEERAIRETLHEACRRCKAIAEASGTDGLAHGSIPLVCLRCVHLRGHLHDPGALPIHLCFLSLSPFHRRGDGALVAPFSRAL